MLKRLQQKYNQLKHRFELFNLKYDTELTVLTIIAAALSIVAIVYSKAP